MLNSQSKPDILNSVLLRMPPARVALLATLHAIIFTLCYPFAWLIRFDFNIPPSYLVVMRSSLLYVVAIELLVGALFGFYRGWWRYVGTHDVIRLVAGSATALLVMLAIWFTQDFTGINALRGVSRGVLLVNWAFSLLTVFGARLFVRLAKDFFRETAGGEFSNALIIGAGDAGEALAREIQTRPQLGLRVVGFVDDQRAKWKSHIRGVEVRGPITDIARIADLTGATEALVAIPTASGARMREIVQMLAGAKLPFRTIPGLDQLVSGKVQVTQLRRINADDLVRRKEIILPGDRVRGLFRGKRVVITGAGGSIGSELALQILAFEPEQLHLIERSELALYELDKRIERERSNGAARAAHPHLMDCDEAGALIASVRPHIVVHAAAHKHVPLGELHAAEYVRNNCVVARTLAAECESAGVERFVFISTDKAVHPSSAMGASKRAAEIALLDFARTAKMKISVVRFGNIIGSSGSVVPLFMEQIAAGGPVTVTDPNATRYFLRRSEAISLILQATVIGESGGMYMLDMGDPIRIVDLARDLIQLSNHSLDDIPIVYVGLRPGEKLNESIRNDKESHGRTEHPHIISVTSPLPTEIAVDAWYGRLQQAVRTQPSAVIPVLQEFMPEYKADDVRPAEPTETFAVRTMQAVPCAS